MARIAGSRPITSSKVPWRFGSPLCERGKIEYQLAKPAPLRSASTGISGLDGAEQPRVRGLHGLVGLGGQQQGQARRVVGLGEALGDRPEPGGGLGRGTRQRPVDEAAALFEFERHREPRPVLGLDLVAEHGEIVAPGLDPVDVAAEPLQRQVGGPAIVAERPHAALPPPGLVGGAPLQRDGDAVVALAEGIDLDPHDVADDALHGVAAAVDRRRRGPR